MKTVLIIAYHYPPENGSCSEKNDRIVRKFVEEEYRVIVLTKEEFSNCLLDDRIAVYRIPNGKFHRNANQVNCENLDKKSESCNSKKTRIKSVLSRLIIPDAVIDWFPMVRRFVRTNSDLFKEVDLIFSISSPYSTHIISRYISKRFGIPYLMCYGDPWIYEPKRKRGPIRYCIEKKMEGKLIRAASGISVITEWNRCKYIDLYHIPPEKINTFLIGFEKKPMQLPDRVSTGECFSMLYGGSLDPVHRNVEPFISAIRDIDGVYVEIRNDDYPTVVEMVNDQQLREKISVKPLIPSTEFEKLQYSFDALILFGNRTPFQIPGKVFTYIATGKTIIYIKNNDFDDDGTELVLKQYGNAIIVSNERNAIVNAIQSYVSQQHMIGTSYPDQFEYGTTMQPLVDLANRILSKKGRAEHP